MVGSKYPSPIQEELFSRFRATSGKVEMQEDEDRNLVVRAAVQIPEKVFDEINCKVWHRGAGMGSY